ncbi:hypothetical protein BEWA_002350 [Theileria equi strain WA]|uniref:Uncharacterized protein n=1 Tax=Theileria equi strain WA TaxID=1537102 RepID=L0AZZ4_THEEQ|nr:hypothetical protein BEWA_002350 [Theileria equi strain WA]AFZ80828.1 hypothetical protein BEWA_002350 [Theileria equi strain WA]|eukprot:XP_004830494.1 hypothetical protein BEWA_002350 [Theileria equi strain WA]
MCGEIVTLDIFSPSPSLFIITDHVLYGVNHRAFVPKDGCSLVSVVDNRDTLWTGKDGEEFTGVHQYSREGYPSLLGIYSKDDESRREVCLEKNDDKWKVIDKLEFETKLYSMKDFAVPIRGSDSTVYGSKELVERLDDSKIELEFSDEPLENASDQAFTTGTASEYTMKPFAENMKELEYFRKVLLTKTPLPVVDEFTLDISNAPDEHFIKLVDDVDNGYKQKKYSPLYGTYKRTIDGTFNKVVDGPAVIWIAQPNERCGYVSCLTKDNKPELVTVAVCGRSDFVAFDRFAKDASGSWTSITVEAFERKMQTIKTTKKRCGCLPKCW